MKINHQAVDAYVRTARVSAPTQVDRSGAAERSQAQPSSVSSEAANVTISSEARALASGGQVDAAKVERLRDQVQNGQFKVDSRAVAQRMIDVVG
ncbi:MAG TPA: flagellar biosynthesis anti-sigma factor FlgM [Polyangiaceae bacterium]|nr:flagellar biosynthesis anti-sigma factor FlgM [Polyangiaceae bacterium]